MQKEILFYQANFDPEVNRMLDAYKSGQEKYFLLFKSKSLKIIDTIISMSNKPVEKEEWFAVRNIVEHIENSTDQMKEIVSVFGVPFSNKYAVKISS
jgi:hypothetical protein